MNEDRSRRDPLDGSHRDQPVLQTRRSFFVWLTGVGTVAVGALLAVPLVRYTLYPVFGSEAVAPWSTLGDLGEYGSLTAPVSREIRIEQVDGWRESLSTSPVYVTRGTRAGALDGIEVLSAVCPHLGCEVPWDAARGQFVCPCHGSVYASDGALVHGPAARGMDTLPLKADNGELKVRYEYFQALLPTKVLVG